MADNQPLDGSPAQAALRILRARIQLAAGELTQAAATAEEALTIAESLGAHGHSSAAHCVLGLIALRQGDLTSAALHVASDSVPGPHSAETYARAEVTMAHAQVSEARDGASAALGHIRRVCADLGSHPGLLLGDPATAPWLTRTALAAGHDELAAAVAQAAQALASANAGYPAVDAAGDAQPGPGRAGHRAAGRGGRAAPRPVGAGVRRRGPWGDPCPAGGGPAGGRAAHRGHRGIPVGRRGGGYGPGPPPAAQAGGATPPLDAGGGPAGGRLGEPDGDRAARSPSWSRRG